MRKEPKRMETFDIVLWMMSTKTISGFNISIMKHSWSISSMPNGIVDLSKVLEAVANLSVWIILKCATYHMSNLDLGPYKILLTPSKFFRLRPNHWLVHLSIFKSVIYNYFLVLYKNPHLYAWLWSTSFTLYHVFHRICKTLCLINYCFIKKLCCRYGVVHKVPIDFKSKEFVNQ